MLKLKNATYPDPESPTLHEQTYDLGKDGSKWAHGYVPLNPAAVALKHHKQPGGDSGGSTAKGIASRDSGSSSRFVVRQQGSRGAHDVIDTHKGNEVVATHSGDGRGAFPGRNSAVKDARERNAQPTAAKSAEPREFKTMAQTRKEASARAFVNSGDVRLHATKDDGGSKIGTVSKYPSGGFRAQHKDDATAHAGSPFATRQEAVGALVLQHESRTPKTQSERVADLRGKLADNAAARLTLEGHAAALQVPIGERTPEQQAAADKALAYAKELRAKRLAAKPPKRKRNTNNGLASTASAAAARRAELDRDKPGFGASSNLRRSGK